MRMPFLNCSYNLPFYNSLEEVWIGHIERQLLYSSCWSSREFKLFDFDSWALFIKGHLVSAILISERLSIISYVNVTSYKFAEKRNVFKLNLVVLKNSKNYFKMEAVISRPIFLYVLFFTPTNVFQIKTLKLVFASRSEQVGEVVPWSLVLKLWEITSSNHFWHLWWWDLLFIQYRYIAFAFASTLIWSGHFQWAKRRNHGFYSPDRKGCHMFLQLRQ